MTQLMWVRSHVERLLQDEWEVCALAVDQDGDYCFRRGTAAGWVQIVDTGDVPYVRVFAFAAAGIKPTVALWRELNEIQGRAYTASVMWADGRVIVSQTISPIGLTRPVLAQALDSVGSVADDIGVLLAGMFGGTTPFPAEHVTAEGKDAA